MRSIVLLAFAAAGCFGQAIDLEYFPDKRSYGFPIGVVKSHSTDNSHAPTCGTRIEAPAHGISEVFVSCGYIGNTWSSYPAMVPATQLTIRATEGDAVRVLVDGKPYYADLVPSSAGGLVGVLFIPGDDHKSVSFRVLAALKRDTM